MNRMKLFASALGLCVMLGVSATAQMTRQMTVSIPFDFYVAETPLPAGTYTVYRTSTQTGDGFLLRDASGQTKVLFSGNQIQSGKSQVESRLEFRSYNDKYFLARVWAGGNDIGRELQQSRLERKTAKQADRNLAEKKARPDVITVVSQ